VVNTSKEANKKISNESYTDNPDLRQEQTTRDRAAKGKPIASLRLTALRQAREMPASEDGTPDVSADPSVFSQAPVAQRDNWIQLGPTAIPN
jgi:hypothetical protein